VRLLLDTNAWLWMTLASERLGPRTYALLADSANAVFLSVVSAWEIVIKAQLGKLRVDGAPEDFVRTRLRLQSIASLEVSLDHVLAVAHLPSHHRDPFDRLIVAQAQSEGLVLVSGDQQLGAYPVAFHDASM
jgi:PIN domain nuclease of toxin-antitoxin system